MQKTNTKISWYAATAIVVANMIGSGVFTSLGFQLTSISNTWSIIILWVFGALMAFCGALSYAEIGTALKRSGGEYHFLSQLFHPVVGYLSGWVSMTVGFAAPIALAGIALVKYAHIFPTISPIITASFTIIFITLFHLINLKSSERFQNITTSFKVVLILVFILFGLFHTNPENALDFSNSWQSEIFYPGFAVSFVYVTFSYSGWNAAAYITDEIKNPTKNLPRALLLGTILVSVIYILLNLVFLKNASLEALQGQLEIGEIVSKNIFGIKGGKLMSIAIAVMLLSSISAMIWVGPRVIKVMAEDYKLWSYFKKTSKKNIPIRAILLQSSIAISMILTGTFEQILIYCGFLLNIFAAITVYGSFILRRKGLSKNTYKSPLYPFTQILFLSFSVWILFYLITQQPKECLFGSLNIIIGLITYLVNKKLIKKQTV